MNSTDFQEGVAPAPIAPLHLLEFRIALSQTTDQSPNNGPVPLRAPVNSENANSISLGVFLDTGYRG